MFICPICGSNSFSISLRARMFRCDGCSVLFESMTKFGKVAERTSIPVKPVKKCRIIIDYDPIGGESLPDGKVQKYVSEIIHLSKNENITSPITLVVGSVVIFDAFRVAVKEKRLCHKDVIIRFQGKDYQLDENGKMNNWPAGLCAVYGDILDRLL